MDSVVLTSVTKEEERFQLGSQILPCVPSMDLPVPNTVTITISNLRIYSFSQVIIKHFMSKIYNHSVKVE